MLSGVVNSVIALFLAIASMSFTEAYDNGVAADPPMGWSTWCTNDICGLRDRCSEFEIRRRADALVEEGLAALGYKWILLDDCWADHQRDADDKLQPNPYQFPNGMKNLVRYVHLKGLKIGLYTCVGTQTCKKNRPGSYGHFDIDAQTFADWGVDMVKADYCNRPYNESGKDLYYQFSQALNATGHPMLFATCQWGEDEVWKWGGDVAQMFRIQMDHIPFWNWGPTAQGAGYGCGTKQIIDWMAELHPSKWTRRHAWMDPDFLETLFEPITMNYTNSRTEFAFWAIWSAPLLVATDVLNLTEHKRAILSNEEVLAIHHDPLYVAGERLFNNSDGSQAWFRPLSNGDVCVILYNSGNFDPVTVTVSWDLFGTDYVNWTADDEISARDLWNKSDMGIYKGSITVENIPVHDHVMVRLSKR